MLRKKIGRHPELNTMQNARRLTEYIRDDPDATHYHFHKGRSTVVFERDDFFLAATEKEVKTLFKPNGGKEGIRKYRRNRVSQWIEF